MQSLLPDWRRAWFTWQDHAMLADGALNFRVRDGTGCAPSSMAADPTGGSCESSLAGGHPGGQHSAQDASSILKATA